MEKPPAFQFYANDFVTGTSTLTTAEVGGYILLLCEQWDKGAIPGGDPKRLAQVMRCSQGLAKAIWASVSSKFARGDDGAWRNERLETVRAEQVLFRLRQAQNGSKGGRPRKPTGNPSHNPPDNPDHNPTQTHKKALRTPVSTRDESKNDSSAPVPGDLLAEHQRLFLAKYGQKPMYDGRDASVAQRLIRKLGLTKATALVEAFFSSRDRWIADCGHGLGCLASTTVQNKLIAEMSRSYVLQHPSAPSQDVLDTRRKIAEMDARPAPQPGRLSAVR